MVITKIDFVLCKLKNCLLSKETKDRKTWEEIERQRERIVDRDYLQSRPVLNDNYESSGATHAIDKR